MFYDLNELLVAQYEDFDLSPDEALSLAGA